MDFVVNADGSVIVLGNTRASSTDDQDIYVAKLNTQAKIVWEVILGESLDDDAKDIELLSDGSLIILANSEVAVGNNDVLLIKLDQNGVETGRVRQGLTEQSSVIARNENAKSITVINSGFVVAGSTSSIPSPAIDKSDYMYMNFLPDLTLKPNWSNTSGYPGEDEAIKIIQKDATTYYVFGSTNRSLSGALSVNDLNFTIFGLGADGEPALQGLYLGSPSQEEKMTGFSDASNQPFPGYTLSGTAQNAVDGDIYFVKLRSQLNFSENNGIKPDVLIERPLGLNLGKSALQKSFNDSPANNTFFVATEKLNGTSLDILLAKLDSRGNKLFEVTFGSKEGDDFAGKVVELADGRILMIGTMTMGGVVDGQKKIAFMKLNSQGKLAP
ncbi:MAG: hypothetical protein HOP30_21395 [Cyclobacteriaceae bacterium]|nr:hypothetical protein [Cyclobacteriaceae bacterium]